MGLWLWLAAAWGPSPPRVLVATAVREAATGAGTDVLLRLAAARERAATAPPAPPEGLIFAGVGYGNHPRWDDRVEG